MSLSVLFLLHARLCASRYVSCVCTFGTLATVMSKTLVSSRGPRAGTWQLPRAGKAKDTGEKDYRVLQKQHVPST